MDAAAPGRARFPAPSPAGARVDGFSIGSNDLTQLVLLLDERDEAVKRMIADVIARAHRCVAEAGRSTSPIQEIRP